MPQGGKAIPAGKCDCGGPLVQIWHRDGHGMETLLEIHCNQCRFSMDGEGIVRNPGNQQLQELGLQVNRRGIEF